MKCDALVNGQYEARRWRLCGQSAQCAACRTGAAVFAVGTGGRERHCQGESKGWVTEARSQAFLAMRSGLPLATLAAGLAKIATSAGVSIFCTQQAPSQAIAPTGESPWPGDKPRHRYPDCHYGHGTEVCAAGLSTRFALSPRNSALAGMIIG